MIEFCSHHEVQAYPFLVASANHPTAASPGTGDTRLTFVSPGCEVGMLQAESCVVLLTSVP